MANMFRLLRADEVDARVGTVKNGKGVSLLLYKDARCDQNVLDETVGPFNWQRTHSRDNANCTVSIWDENKKQWISKEDTGTESNTEAEKGLASDSFKRACFNWGIGRELYTAPFIWIAGDTDKLKYERFTVTELGYSDDRSINRLVITDKKGDVVYSFGKDAPKAKAYKAPQEPQQEAVKVSGSRSGNTERIRAYCEEVGITLNVFANLRSALVSEGIVPAIASNEMTEQQLTDLIEAVEERRIA